MKVLKEVEEDVSLGLSIFRKLAIMIPFKSKEWDIKDYPIQYPIIQSIILPTEPVIDAPLFTPMVILFQACMKAATK